MRGSLNVHVLAVVVAVATVSVRPAQVKGTYRVTAGEVVVTCPLTIGGRFEARTKELSGDLAWAADRPGILEGALRVPLQTLETGIALRDRHMHSNYLEVDKGSDFATAVLEDLRIDRLDGKSAFSGTLSLHGQRKEITGTAQVQQRDGAFRVRAQFALRVSDFQIPAPNYLGVGVRDEILVHVTLTMAAAPQQSASK